AGVDSPSLKILAFSVVNARVADPAGIWELRSEADGILAVGSHAAGREIENRGSGRIIKSQFRIIGEFVPNTCSYERLPNNIVARNGGPEGNPRGTNRLANVMEKYMTRRHIEVTVSSNGNRINLKPSPDEAGRRLQEP